MIAISLGVLAALCWGTHDLIAKRFAAETGPFRMTLWVMILGGVALLPVMIWRGPDFLLHQQGLLLAGLMGLIYAGAVGGLFKAFSLAPVSVVGPFTAGYPTLVVFWNIANGLVPGVIEWLALFLCLAGAVVVAMTGPKDGGINAIAQGDLPQVIISSALASICFASVIVVGQKAAGLIGEFETTFVSRFTAALAILPLALRERGAGAATAISTFAWGGILLMAILDVAAVSAVNAAGAFPGAEYSAMGISLYGGVAPFLAWLLLKERVSAGQWIGIAMIILGVGLLGWPR